MTTCAGVAMASYDEAVPHPQADVALARRFAAIRCDRAASDVRGIDVVLVVSSSRGGSSMLANILRWHSGLLSLPGEMNPYVVLAQLAGGDATIVRDEIARDIGRPVDPRQTSDPVDLARLARDVEFRLAMQWPHHDFAAVDVTVAEAAAEVEPAEGDAFTLAVLSRLGLETSAYDVSEDVARDGVADAARSGPPPPPVLEMAPYVPLRPWRAPTGDELRRCPLVIATPRNSFRIPWLRGLLSDCRVRVIHLTRNPAASVNGLLDGWQDDGFFTTPMPEGLRIEGYSELHPWGERWWKFDVPPRWRQFVRAPLAAVAAEQWRAAHQAVVEAAGSDVVRVRYEDVVGSPEQRASAGRALAQFLGVDEDETIAAVVAGTRPVMATAPPARRRWSRSGHDLAPALAEPAVWEMAVELGYDVDERLWI